MATEKNISSRIINKHDIEANWNKATNFIPKAGEIIVYDRDETYDYERFKIGDGETKVIDLKFVNQQSDWNQTDSSAPDFIKNKTHYEEEIKTVLIEEMIVNCNEYAGYKYVAEVEIGESTKDECDRLYRDIMDKKIEVVHFRVVFDGVPYDVTHTGIVRGVIGNLTFWDNNSGHEDTGEPFAFTFSGHGMFVVFGEQGEHTIAISRLDETVVHHLDPKYIKDMYYEEYVDSDISGVVYTDLLDETSSIPTIHNKNIPFALGQVWSVAYCVGSNGSINTDYSALDVQQADDGTIYIGDYPNKRYPTPFYITSNEFSADLGWIRIMAPYNVTITCDSGIISATEPTIHKVPSKYVGTDWNQNNPDGDGYIANRTHWDNGIITSELVTSQAISGFVVMQDSIYAIDNPFELTLVEGATYIVNWDNVEYECICKMHPEEFLYIGNENYIMMQPGGDFPFSILDSGDIIFVATESTEESHNISIVENKHDLKQLDMKYLPKALQFGGVDEVVIFDGTVTNDGTSLSVTNYVEKYIRVDVYWTCDGVEGRFKNLYLGNGSYTLCSNNFIDISTYGTGNFVSMSAFSVDGNPHDVKIWLRGKDISITCIDEKFLPIAAKVGQPYYSEDGEMCGEVFNVSIPNHESMNQALGIFSHAEGRDTSANGLASHAEGGNTIASNNYAHAEGAYTVASGSMSHAEGCETTASGSYSHAEGCETTASGSYSHAEGLSTTASHQMSHAEGNYTTASADYGAHAEGNYTTASGPYGSHAEGHYSVASGFTSHAEGRYTIAAKDNQHVQGKYNIEDTTNQGYAHIVGNGTDKDARSNAHTLDWDGNAWFSGDVYVGSTSGTNKDEGSVRLATVNEIQSRVLYENTTVFPHNWHYDADEKIYVADLYAVGTTEGDIAQVIFNPMDIIKHNLCQKSATKTGRIQLYSMICPTENIVIPQIILYYNNAISTITMPPPL